MAAWLSLGTPTVPLLPHTLLLHALSLSLSPSLLLLSLSREAKPTSRRHLGVRGGGLDLGRICLRRSLVASAAATLAFNSITERCKECTKSIGNGHFYTIP